MNKQLERESRLPREKKALAYSTLMKFRTPVVQQMAWEWWGIAPAFKTKIQLIDEILVQQELEYGVADGVAEGSR